MILVGIDDRPSARDALALARWLAAARSEDLLLAWGHPYERLPSLLGDGREERDLREAIDAIAEKVRASLPAGFRPELRLVSGRSPAQALGALAEREQASLIVIGSSERAGVGRIVPGSTALRLLSGASVPVAVAPRGYVEPEEVATISVGFDGGPEAKGALSWATGLADELGGRLRLVAVHQPIAFANVRTGAFPVESVGQALRRELQGEVEEAKLSVAGNLPMETVFRDGDPATELIAASTETDLLVLGSRGYGPLRSVLLGSVSDVTVAGSRVPVVVVPRGQGDRTDDD